MLNRFDNDHRPSEKKKRPSGIAVWSRPSRTVKEVIQDGCLVALFQKATDVGIVNLDFNDES
jgi:hypothetical protein